MSGAVACPKCGKTFDVAPEQIAGPGIRLFCDRCKTVFGLSDTSDRRALIVHGSDAMADIVKEIVRDAGWVLTRVKNGEEALRAMGTEHFRLAVVDVATDSPYAFELVPALKKTRQTQVVLLASVYDKTAYKRRPSSLYGADAYLEQHHLPDKLPAILASLDGGADDVDRIDPKTDMHHAVSDPQSVQQKREALRRAADEQLGNGGRLVTPGDRPDLDPVKDVTARAKALAKKLVLDISLYDEAAFVRGLQAGTLEEALAPQLAEAKRFLAERIPPPLAKKDADAFIDRALEELCAQDGRRKT